MSKKYMRVQKNFKKKWHFTSASQCITNLRATDWEMTTPLLLLRSMCITGNPYQRIGSAEIGTVLDIYTELQRDDEPHDQLAS